MVIDEKDSSGTDRFADMLRLGVELALTEKDFGKALDSFDAKIPEICPELLGGIAPGLPRKPFSMALLRDIWNRTPCPDNDWRPRALPKPERNAACPCGSGEKFKACCSNIPPLPFGPGLSLLRFVLERAPRESYAQLPWRRLDPEELAFTAQEWMKDGDYDLARALLEALFVDLSKLDGRHEVAFDALADLYLEQGEDESRAKLVLRVQTAPDRELRAVAWQRWATVCADRGEREASWEAYATAQKIDPESPSLAHLEITMLIAEGEIERAQARAGFWAKRLRKRRDVNPQLVELLEDCAEDPRLWMRAMGAGEIDAEHGDTHDAEDFEDEDYGESVYTEVLPRFIAVATPRTPPECHHRLQVLEDSAGELTPDVALALIERAWREVFPLEDAQDEGLDLWINPAWIEWLGEHPLALQSFAVIEGLMLAIDAAPVAEELDDALDELYSGLLAHAMALLRLVIAKNGAEGKKLEWGWLENRPALRLASAMAMELSDRGARIELLEWMVFTLNPNDNQGLREDLLHLYLEQGQAERAWKVCEAYPDDALTGMLYGRALTLFVLGRRDEADAALREAMAAAPEAAKFLAKKSSRPPKDIGDEVMQGSKEEAWLYYVRNEELWKTTGAAAWVRNSLKG